MSCSLMSMYLSESKGEDGASKGISRRYDIFLVVNGTRLTDN
jgi:hypothetical protein